jgi:hypothetical protein
MAIVARKMKSIILYVAPRGLITVLLFYSIPSDVMYEGFQPGIVLWIILITSLYMSYGLITRAKEEDESEPFETESLSEDFK